VLKTAIVAAASAALLATASPAASAETCRPDPRVEQVAADWLARRPQTLLQFEPGQGPCFRDALIERLSRTLGPPIGYKVGAYAPASRKTYGLTHPVVGPLLKGMMYPEGATVPADFGRVPLWEADFLLVVKDEGINTARTREEIYRHLRGYQTFFELADRHFPTNVTLNADQWQAFNMSARAGMAGKEIPLPQTPEAFAKLAAMTVEAEVTGPDGVQRRSAKATENLGDPVDVVLQARDALVARGGAFKAGDVISLGSLLPATPIRAGETVTARWTVLGAPDVLTVRFR
jgi:2-oxo-hept-3-ene-1,7-dioate hydratase